MSDAETEVEPAPNTSAVPEAAAESDAPAIPAAADAAAPVPDATIDQEAAGAPDGASDPMPEVEALFSAAGLETPETPGEPVPPAPSEMEEMLRQSVEEGLGDPESIAATLQSVDDGLANLQRALDEPSDTQSDPADVQPTADADLGPEVAELERQTEVEAVPVPPAEPQAEIETADLQDVPVISPAIEAMLPVMEEIREAQAAAARGRTLRGRLAWLARAAVYLLVLVDKPFGWVGAELKRLLGGIALATLVVAGCTLLLGPRLVAHLQAAAATQPAVVTQ